MGFYGSMWPGMKVVLDASHDAIILAEIFDVFYFE